MPHATPIVFVVDDVTSPVWASLGALSSVSGATSATQPAAAHTTARRPRRNGVRSIMKGPEWENLHSDRHDTPDRAPFRGEPGQPKVSASLVGRGDEKQP